MSKEQELINNMPKMISVGKDEHLVIMLDASIHTTEDLEVFRKELTKNFPKLTGRVIVILGEGIHLAKV